MKLTFILICLLFTSIIQAQSFLPQSQIDNEAHKRQLSKIKSCTVKEYKYSFGKRNAVGQTTEYLEYNKDGYELLRRTYEEGTAKMYSQYEYDNQNNAVSYTEYDTQNQLTLKRVNIFNNNSQHVESCNYNPLGEIQYKQFYSFDSKGRQIGGKTLQNNGDLYSKWEYKYNGGNLTEEVFYNLEGKITGKNIYEYNKNKKIKEVIFKEDGAKSREKTFEYPTKNKIITKDSWYLFAEPIVNKIISILDKKGNKIEEYLEKPDGSINWRSLYKYDDNGNLLEEVTNSSLNEPEKAVVYEYEY